MDFASVSGGGRQDLGVPAAGTPRKRDGLVLRGAADEELMNVEALERAGDELIIRGKSFGTLPIEARLDGPSARAGLRMLGLRKLAFLASLPFRRSSSDRK